MATPVDSSFSSQPDDFENMNDSELSESLIHCLNGNEPVEYVGIPTADTPNKPVTPLSTTTPRSLTRANSMKRPMGSDDTAGTIHGTNDNPFVDCNFISAKKNHLELDETSL